MYVYTRTRVYTHASCARQAATHPSRHPRVKQDQATSRAFQAAKAKTRIPNFGKT